MFWIDPDCGVSLIALTDRMFDEWTEDALRLWPQLSDAVLAEVAQPSSQPPSAGTAATGSPHGGRQE
jgi:hypothetical protein